MQPTTHKNPQKETRNKIALCLFKYFPHGGLQRDFLRIALLLAEKYSISIFTTHWEGEVPANLSVNIVPVSGLTNHRRMQRFGKKIIQQAKEQGCKKIISFNKLPNIDMYFAADNCYVMQANKKHGLFYRLSARYRVYSSLEKSVFEATQNTKILVLTNQQKIDYQEIYSTPHERFHVLPPDFNIPSINVLDKNISQNIRTLYGIKSDEHLILMVCSAFKTKGVDRALEALKQLPLTLTKKIHLLIIGKDKPDPYLSLANTLEAKIQFLGARDNVLEYMLASDLLLHPAYHEAAGKVLLEAMSCGLPILTTAQCGYAEHIEKAGAGVVLQEPVSREVLAKTLASMLLSPQKSDWSQQALKYVAQYPATNLAVDAANFVTDQVPSP